jgi:DNA repair exonuclease SbcCD ATPase subunit
MSEDTQPTPVVEPPAVQDTDPPAPAPDAGTDTTDLQAKFEDMRKQKSRTNKENQELKKNYEAMQAKIQEYEDRDKSELEKAQAAKEKAEKAMLDMAAKAAHLERVASVVSAGVESNYSDYIAGELAKAQDADGELDVSKWMEDYKTKNPAFFGSKTPAPASGQGGPGPANGKGGKAGQLQLINEQIETLMKKQPSEANEVELFNLRRQAKLLKASMSQ